MTRIGYWRSSNGIEQGPTVQGVQGVDGGRVIRGSGFSLSIAKVTHSSTQLYVLSSVPREKILLDVAIADEPTHTVRQRQTGQRRPSGDRTVPSRSVSGLDLQKANRGIIDKHVSRVDVVA
ncbi:hypothetical protein M0804_009572 [Polistes exclamans]|nr:hypothetical protein M0804_009572 [Polistes exclamans]